MWSLEVAPEHPVGHAARHHQPPKWSRVHGQGILQPEGRANFSELRTSEVRSTLRARSHSLLCAEDAACLPVQIGAAGYCRSEYYFLPYSAFTSPATGLDSSPKRLRTSSYGTPSASASSSARRSISLVECHLLASLFHRLGLRLPTFFSEGGHQGAPATSDHLAHGGMIPLIRKSEGVLMHSACAI